MFIMKFNVLEENQIKSLNSRLNFPPPYTFECKERKTQSNYMLNADEKNTTQLYEQEQDVMIQCMMIIVTLIDWLRL